LIESNASKIRLIIVILCNPGCFELKSKLVLILRTNHPLAIDLSRHLKTDFAGLPGFFCIVDEPEKLSIVCPNSKTLGITGNGAIGAWSC
jgi:hypothetical protein